MDDGQTTPNDDVSNKPTTEKTTTIHYVEVPVSRLVEEWVKEHVTKDMTSYTFFFDPIKGSVVLKLKITR